MQLRQNLIQFARVIKLFQVNVPFLHPLKTLENLWFFLRFQGGFLTFSGGIEREDWPKILLLKEEYNEWKVSK